MDPSRLTPTRSSQSVAAAALFFAVSFSGCSKSSTLEPSQSVASASGGTQATAAEASGYGSGSYYPLAIGNSWNYEGGGTVLVFSDDGGVPVEEYSYAFTEAHRLIGTTRHEGTEYVVEEQIHREIPESPYGPFTWWDRLRQDSRGLFSLDTLLQTPPILEGNGIIAAAFAARARHALRIDPASWRRDGVADASPERFADRVQMLREVVRGMIRRGDPPAPSGLEIKRLIYPLHPGVNWSIRPDFPWPARVDRMEVLDTPAGKFHTFRIDVNPFGNLTQEGEWVRAWYSRDGFLGYSIHTFYEGTDGAGEPTGITYVSDDWMTIASMQIDR